MKASYDIAAAVQDAIACLQRGDVPVALDALERLAADAPSEPDVLRALVVAYQRVGWPQAAGPLAERLVDRDADPEDVVLRADLLLSLGQASEARRAIDAALVAWPGSHVLQTTRARADLALGDTAAAVADARRGATLAPTDASARGMLAQALLSDARPREALDVLGQGAHWPALRAEVHAALNDTAAAIRDLQAATALPDAFPATFSRLAVLCSHARRYEEAVQAAQIATDREPADPEAWATLAIVHGAAGHESAAADALGRAATLPPLPAWVEDAARAHGTIPASRDPVALAALVEDALDALERRDLAAALERFERAGAQGLSGPLLHLGWATALYYLGRHAEAVVRGTVAARLDPGSAKAWGVVAASAWMSGDRARAGVALARALRCADPPAWLHDMRADWDAPPP